MRSRMKVNDGVRQGENKDIRFFKTKNHVELRKKKNISVE